MNQLSLATVLAGVFSLAQAQPVSIRIEPVNQKNNGAEVRVKITNLSQNELKILNWYLAGDAELQSDIFSVFLDGQAVDYSGPIAKRGLPEERDYIHLAPSASVIQTVDLSAYYDMTQAGIYHIQYHVNVPGVIQEVSALKTKIKQNADEELVSNDLSFWMDGIDLPYNVLSKLNTSALNINQGLSYLGNCSNSQKVIIQDALVTARQMGRESGSYLDQNWQPDKAGIRYKTWFGDYSATRFAKVADHFHLLSDALNYKHLTIDCFCKEKLLRTYAYVYRNQPYHIHLCQAFWSAPLTGHDSRSGTMIHEMSHFTVNGGTYDYAYGHYRAKRLAVLDPDKAIMNADNHEYFSENTPALK
ncbi:M35 family metallo-endopeptidase [Vibrio aerogenes]|nr:M35 family metallo-endopeptidase [Vibrio aerogenes]